MRPPESWQRKNFRDRHAVVGARRSSRAHKTRVRAKISPRRVCACSSFWNGAGAHTPRGRIRDPSRAACSGVRLVAHSTRQEFKTGRRTVEHVERVDRTVFAGELALLILVFARRTVDAISRHAGIHADVACRARDLGCFVLLSASTLRARFLSCPVLEPPVWAVVAFASRDAELTCIASRAYGHAGRRCLSCIALVAG